MKKVLSPGVAIVIGLLFLVSCKKGGPSYMNSATILGPDLRTGPCQGGGYFIVIDGHPNPNSQNGAYTADSIPSSFPIPTGTHFPFGVKLDWKVESKCDGNDVAVSKIERD